MEDPVDKLMVERVERKWDSFSWIAARPLISSLNDQVNRQTQGLVGELRQAWRSRTVEPADWDDARVIDRRHDDSFIVLGDPGEQDRSQYVVAAALATAGRQAGFVVICSDVIYPSGDVNDYVDGFYVPYQALAHKAIFALPGNHDWYDGLTGFMWHFCGLEELDRSAYGVPKRAGGTVWIARLLWRRPSRRKGYLKLTERRASRRPDGADWRPLQPGSYFAIDTKHVRLVCIDTGITGEVDDKQASWIVEVSNDPDRRPKILLTGKPLVVNGGYEPGHIAPEANTTSDGEHGFRTVDDIVRHPAHNYVAAIGGDLHNFQHYRGELEGRRLDYIVSGGGGAYMSATHTIPTRACPDGPLGARDEADQGGAQEVGAALADPVLYPSREESLQYFAGQLLPRLWRLVRALGLVVVGMGAGAAAQWRLDDPATRDALAICAAALGLLFAGRIVLPARVTRGWPFRLGACVTAVVVGAVLVLATWWLTPDHVLRLVLGWAGLTAGGAIFAAVLRAKGSWQADPARFLVRAAVGQAVVALVLTILIVPGGARWDVAWSLGGVILLAGVVVLSLGALVLAAAVVAGVVAAVKVRPFRRAWGFAGVVQPLLAGFVAAGIVGAGFGLDAITTAHDHWRVSVTAAAAPAVVVGALFALDWLRRTARPSFYRRDAVLLVGGLVFGWRWGALDDVRWWAVALTVILGGAVLFSARQVLYADRYKLDAAILLAAAIALLWHYDVASTWVLDAAVGAAILLVVVLLAIAIAHLTFLGVQWLAVDLAAHREGRDLFTLPQASEVLEWRGGGPAPAERRVRRRADIVFPGAHRPHGPLQAAVSEVFDSDRPPFYKHFLKIACDERELRITRVEVTGAGTRESNPITVPLGQQAPSAAAGGP
jgi:hypothetical protein